MFVRQQSIFTTNSETGELTYEECFTVPETYLSIGATILGSIVAWPIFALMSTVTLPHNIYLNLKARWHQHKMIRVLSDENSLRTYSENRIKQCDKQIEKLKSHICFLLEKEFNKPEELGLPIPQPKSLSDRLSPRLPESYWADFPWDEFVQNDFLEMSRGDTPDKKTLLLLEQSRIKLDHLMQQQEVLAELNGDEKLEAMKRIAELSFVKYAFIRQEARTWIINTFICLFPLGIFLAFCLNHPTNRRAEFHNKKQLLPNLPNFQKYKDLVDAHNQFVSQSDCLVPYIENRLN